MQDCNWLLLWCDSYRQLRCARVQCRCLGCVLPLQNGAGSGWCTRLGRRTKPVDGAALDKRALRGIWCSRQPVGVVHHPTRRSLARWSTRWRRKLTMVIPTKSWVSQGGRSLLTFLGRAPSRGCFVLWSPRGSWGRLRRGGNRHVSRTWWRSEGKNVSGTTWRSMRRSSCSVGKIFGSCER